MMVVAQRIGEVARGSGVSIDTIRYYERRQLLPTASRTAGGYRIFAPDTVERVQFIKQAQELGFTLDEISTLLRTKGETDCLSVYNLLNAKLTEIDVRIKTMKIFRDKLIRHLTDCKDELEKHPDSAECPVVDEIALSSGVKQAQRTKLVK